MIEIETTTLAQADQICRRLSSQKQAWVKVDIPARIAYLQACLRDVVAIAPDWVEISCALKGIDPGSNLAGEEWLIGPVATVINLRQLIQSLAAGGQLPPLGWRTRPDGQAIADVFPRSRQERLLWLGYRAEVWIQPGQPHSQGAIYRDPHPTGRVGLVLGAGNISGIAPMDALYKLFVENQVVLLKLNPVNASLGPYLEQGFQSLIQAGWLQILSGGAELGDYLCQHPQIETIHITGSHLTHDAIVWGPTPQAQAIAKAKNLPRIRKPISSELGCVTPIIVVPGPWSAADLAFQSRHLASMVAHNASFNCVAGKVLITAAGWTLRQQFLQQVEQALAQTPARTAYYPGAQIRYQQFLNHYPQAKPLGAKTPEAKTKTALPWTFIPAVPAQAGEYALTQEAFCGLLAEVSLAVDQSPDQAADFLSLAVDFVNTALWGNLSCVLLIHPQTQQRLGDKFEQAIAGLAYGSIGINLWTGVGFMLTATPWGAFPGNDLKDISSGRGVVHNTYLFDYPQKSVVQAPFRIFPTPAWFVGHRSLLALAKQLLQYEANPTWKNCLRTLLIALRG
jgi:Aldehyde dehydrogenase family